MTEKTLLKGSVKYIEFDVTYLGLETPVRDRLKPIVHNLFVHGSLPTYGTDGTCVTDQVSVTGVPLTPPPHRKSMNPYRKKMVGRDRLWVGIRQGERVSKKRDWLRLSSGSLVGPTFTERYQWSV